MGVGKKEDHVYIIILIVFFQKSTVTHSITNSGPHSSDVVDRLASVRWSGNNDTITAPILWHNDY